MRNQIRFVTVACMFVILNTGVSEIASSEPIGTGFTFSPPPSSKWTQTNSSGPSRRQYSNIGSTFKWKSPNNTADEELSVSGNMIIGEYVSFKGAMSVDIYLKNHGGATDSKGGGLNGRMYTESKPDSYVVAWTGKNAKGDMLEFVGTASYSLAFVANPVNKSAAETELKSRMAQLVSDINATMSSISSSAVKAPEAAKPKPKVDAEPQKPKVVAAPKPEAQTAVLNIFVETDLGTSWVENAVVKLRNAATNKPLPDVVVNSQNTYVKVKASAPDAPVKIKIDSVTIPEKAIYRLPMGQLASSNLRMDITLPKYANKVITLGPNNRYEADFRAVLPLCTQLVTVSKWDESKNRYSPANANLYLKGEKSGKLLLGTTDMTQYKKTGSITLYIPSVELFKTSDTAYNLIGIDPVSPPMDKIKDMKTINAVPSDMASTAVHLTLISPMGRLREWQAELGKQFNKIGGALGTKMGKVKFISDTKPDWVSNKDNFAYSQGEVWIPVSFDHTSPASIQEVMHEWGHHIAWAMGVEAGKGTSETGKEGHNVWDKSPSKDLAWDEARAHFFSIMLPKLAEIPNAKNDFTAKEAKNKTAMKPTAGNPTPGEWVEGAAAASLFECYSGKTMTNQDILKDFINIQNKQKSDGKTIKNINDFFAAKEAEDPSQKSSIEAIKKKYEMVK